MRDIAAIASQRFKRRLLVSCLTALIGGPCLCAAFLLLFTVVFPALEAQNSQDVPVYLGVVFLGATAVFLAVPVLIAAVLVVRRARALDAVFQPLGLSGSPYMLYGRQYHGQIGGRQVDVYIYRGPSVELHLQTRVQAGLQVVAKDSLPAATAGLFNRQALRLENPRLADLSIYPVDGDWAGDLLELPEAVEALQALMAVGAPWAVFRRVELQAGEAALHLHRSRSFISSPLPTEIEARAWLAALQRLAASAERIPEPRVKAPMGSVTPASRQKMNTFLTYAVAGILIGGPLCMVTVFLIALGFAFITP